MGMIQYILLKILIVANAYMNYGYVQSLQCLKCENVIAPILCNGKATCDSNEVCFIDKFKGFDEEILFNLGCRLNPKCSIQGGVDVCTNCCDSDLCNYGGCGETAPVNHHGPVCLSCKQSRNPAKCDSISICVNGEVCHIEEINQSGIKFYTSGCLSEHLCHHFLTPTDIFGKRTVNRTDRSSVVTCASCCHENLCNSNCPAAMSKFTTKEQPSFTTTSTIRSTTPTHSSFKTTEMTTTSVPRGDHKGTEFFLMFLINFGIAEKPVKLIITTNNTATVNIYSPYTGVNKTIFVTQGVAHVDLPNTIDSINTGLISRGIHVLSDQPISVVGFSNYNPNCCTAIAFNALAADKQGHHYKIQTLFRSSSDTQSFGIVSAYPDTAVVITSIATGQQSLTISGKHLKDHENVTIKLNQLECYYYEISVNFDISGLIITGNQPFVVFSGNKQVYISSDAESTVESIPSSNTWGKTFVVPLIQAVTIYLKIIVNDARTVVNITGRNYSKSFTSNNTIQVEVPADSYSVTANYPILLAVITKYVNSSISPFMSIVPAITQFSNDYIVAGPSIMDGHKHSYRNYLSIVIDQKYASGLKMNGNDLQALQETGIALDNLSYKCMIVKISGSSAHKISHVQPNAVFGAIVYGYGYDDAYGYPAGLRL